jgi:DNA polymerase III subunit delta
MAGHSEIIAGAAAKHKLCDVRGMPYTTLVTSILAGEAMSEKRVNWVYLFHGEDDLTSREAVQGLVARMKESPMGEYNVSFLDGEKLPIAEVVGTCQTFPLMADKRLVVVTGLLAALQEKAPRGAKKGALEELQRFLPTVPEFCRLVFVEDQLVPERDPVLKTIQGFGGFVKAHRLDERGLLGWIQGRARKLGCRLSADAADELAVGIGPNARLLNSEMVKLATYCGDRTVGVEDVRALVGEARKADIFAMVDALGQRQTGVALRELRKLLAEGDHPLRVMAMVIRQFRLLLQVKELSEAGASPDEIASRVGSPPRAVHGLQRQARNFSSGQLERIYDRLLEWDLQVKTGLREPEAAIELLVVELNSPS